MRASSVASRSRKTRSITSVRLSNDSVNANEYVALRMRGLPWNVSMDDVYFFFSDYKVVKGSAKLGLN